MSASARAGADTERGSSGAPSRAARYAAVAADCAVSIAAGPRAPDGCLRAAIPDDSGGRCPCGLLLPERRPTQACTSSPEATGVPGISVRSSAISQIPDLQPGVVLSVMSGGPKRCSDCESRCPPLIRDGRSTTDKRAPPLFAANVGDPTGIIVGARAAGLAVCCLFVVVCRFQHLLVIR